MFILPWIRQDGKKGVNRVLAFMFNNTLWKTDEEILSEDEILRDYLKPNGFILGKRSFWLDGVWFPEISQETNISEFYFQKDQPAEDDLRWVNFYWTKENLGINEFHKNHELISGINIYNFLARVFSPLV